ncbi:hypothetical protein ACOMHN_043470 [Nucella lapillus]
MCMTPPHTPPPSFIFESFTEKGVTPDPEVPYFLPRPNNLTVHRGDTAVLPCAIGNVGTKTVPVNEKQERMETVTQKRHLIDEVSCRQNPWQAGQ